MWGICEMIVLTDVTCLRVIFAIAWVVTQRFHSLLATLVNHDGVVVPTCRLQSDPLESVFASVGTISASQITRERRVWFVWRGLHAHDPVAKTFARSSPSVGITMST